jgi:hypothetical protein
LVAAVAAQVPGGGGPASLNTGLIRVLGSTNAFSAKAEVRVLDRNRNRESITMTMNFAQLYSRIRAEIDMGKIKSGEIGSNDVATLRQLGLDQLITVIRLDRMTAMYAYPTLRGYVELPLPAEEATSRRLTPVASETIDGRLCTKFKVTSSDERGEKEKLEAYVWKARDRRSLPVKVQIYQPDAVVVMQFTDIKGSRPQYGLFEPPIGYTRYESMEALTLSRMLSDQK